MHADGPGLAPTPTPDGLFRLMAWLSPAYPVGAFSYSHGLEWPVETGALRDARTLTNWLTDVLERGAGWNDAILFSHAWRATMESNDVALRRIAELAAAYAPTRERKLETCAQGDAFVTVTRAAWPCDAIERLIDLWPGQVAYPVAVAVAAAGHGIGLDPSLAATVQAFAANLVSAAVRLIPLGQTDGQRTMAGLAPTVADVARRAAGATLDELGGVTWLGDVASMRHETQYTRLFRS